MSAWIGIDIGGTNIKIASVSPKGEVLARGVVETSAKEGPARAFRRIHDAARHLAGTRAIGGIGIGCAGLIDQRRGILRESPNLPAWRGMFSMPPVAATLWAVPPRARPANTSVSRWRRYSTY